MLQIGLVIFLIGSILCGLSQNMPELIAFRAIQGLGGGGLMVRRRRRSATSCRPATAAATRASSARCSGSRASPGRCSAASSPTNLSWRWIFYINIPLGIARVRRARRDAAVGEERVHHTIDYLGAGLLAAGLTSIVLVTTLGGNTYDWGSPIIVGLGVAGVVFLGGFVFAERRAAEPVLPLSLFRNSVFTTTSLVGLIVGFALFGSVTTCRSSCQVVNAPARPLRACSCCR